MPEITPLRELDRTAPTFKADCDVFFGSEMHTFSLEVEAARVEVVAKEASAAAAAATATTKAADATAQAGISTTQAGHAADSAASALNAPGTSATSTTSLTITVAAKTLTIQPGKSIVPGMHVMLANTAAPSTQYMRGPVTAYNSATGQLDVDVDYKLGTGTVATWTVSLTGAMTPLPAYAEAAAALSLYQLFGVL